MNKGRCLLCLGKDGVEHILLSCPKNQKVKDGICKLKYEEGDSLQEHMKGTNQAFVMDLGRYLKGRVKCK